MSILKSISRIVYIEKRVTFKLHTDISCFFPTDDPVRVYLAFCSY